MLKIARLWLHPLQVNAAVGCLARMPLPHAAFKPSVQHPASRSTQGQRQQGLERSASRFGSELWAPYLRDTALRVFGSVGVAGQLGHFCRPVLDFTAGAPPLPCLLCALLHLVISQACIGMLFISQDAGQDACKANIVHLRLLLACCGSAEMHLTYTRALCLCGHAVVTASCALRCSNTTNLTFYAS